MFNYIYIKYRYLQVFYKKNEIWNWKKERSLKYYGNEFFKFIPTVIKGGY
jgi:hypothetical protein